MINYIKKYFDILIYTAIFFLFYKNLFIFGDFVRDDWSIKFLYDLTYFEAIKEIFGPFTNRPFAALFYSTLSRFSNEFIFFLIINFILIAASSYLIISNIYFIKITNNLKKLYIFLTLFPLFSYSIILSSGMQIIGNLSVFLWSISFYFHNKFLINNKFSTLVISNLILLLMIMTYESALPLLSLNIMFLIFFKRELLFKYFIVLSLTILIGAILQKIVISNIFPDISRFRINELNFNNLIYYFFGNIVLLINNFFILFQHFLTNLRDLFLNKILLFEYILLIGLLSILIFNGSFVKNNTKINKNIFFLFSVASLFLCSFFIILIHTLALSGSSIYGYNNRALVSLSFILPFIIIMFGLILRSIYFKILVFTYTVILFTNFIVVLNKNVEYVKNRNSNVENIIYNFKKNNNDINYLIFIDHYGVDDKIYNRVTYTNDNFDYRHLLKYKSKGNLFGTSINANKYCNKRYWDVYFSPYIDGWFNVNKSMYLIDSKEENTEFILFVDLNEIWRHLNKRFECGKKFKDQITINKKLGKFSNKNFINDSLFLNFIINFNNKVISRFFN